MIQTFEKCIPCRLWGLCYLERPCRSLPVALISSFSFLLSFLQPAFVEVLHLFVFGSLILLPLQLAVWVLERRNVLFQPMVQITFFVELGCIFLGKIVASVALRFPNYTEIKVRKLGVSGMLQLNFILFAISSIEANPLGHQWSFRRNNSIYWHLLPIWKGAFSDRSISIHQ